MGLQKQKSKRVVLGRSQEIFMVADFGGFKEHICVTRCRSKSSEIPLLPQGNMPGFSQNDMVQHLDFQNLTRFD